MCIAWQQSACINKCHNPYWSLSRLFALGIVPISGDSLESASRALGVLVKEMHESNFSAINDPGVHAWVYTSSLMKAQA